MTSSNGSPPPSNGSLPHDPASILLGMKFGERLTQLQHRTDSHDQRITACERHLLQQARVQSLIMDGQTLILRLYATQAQEKTTASSTTPAKASPGSDPAISSTLVPVIRKLARKLSPEVGLWLATRVGLWLWPYLLAGWPYIVGGLAFLYTLLRGYAKFLGVSFG